MNAAALGALGSFFADVAAYLGGLFAAGVQALTGPVTLPPAALAAIEAEVEAQQGYLTSFELETTSADALPGNFAARAEQYGAAVWGAAQAVVRDAVVAAGPDYEECRVHIGDDEPCPVCTDLEDQGWMPIGTLPDIGDSYCLYNCHCVFYYRVAGSDQVIDTSQVFQPNLTGDGPLAVDAQADIADVPIPPPPRQVRTPGTPPQTPTASVLRPVPGSDTVLPSATPSPFAGIEDDFGTIMLGPEPVAVAPAAPQPARAPRPVVPAPPPSPPPAVQPGGVPVSSALNVEVPGAFGQRLDAAIAAIDSVHGDGNLPTIPINTAAMAVGRGGQIAVRNGVPVYINVAENGFGPELALIHEIGHDLDYGALRGLPGSDALMAPVQAALRNSAAAQELARLATVESVPATGLDLAGVTRSFNLPIDQAHIAYISSNDELWARAYAQYIAIRSGDTTLMDQLNLRRGPGPLSFRYPEQWTDADFAPIASAIDALFQRLGWLH